MAVYDDDMEDFDFDGGDMEGVQAEVEKRGIDPILDDEEEEEELYPSKKPSLTGEDFATTTILNLRSNLEEKERAVKNMEERLSDVEKELTQWKDTFHGNPFEDPTILPNPSSVYEAVLRLQNSNKHLQEKADAATKKENFIQLKLLQRDLELSSFKEKMEIMKFSLMPQVQQTNTILLNPRVYEEFNFLKATIETLEKKCRGLEDDLAAVEFTPHSKHGKMLMAKCRTLQEENEEMGMQNNEGRIHELETKLGLQKQLNAELKQGYAELQEYVDDMNEESEKQQALVFSLQQQLKDKGQILTDKPSEWKAGKSSSKKRDKERLKTTGN